MSLITHGKQPLNRRKSEIQVLRKISENFVEKLDKILRTKRHTMPELAFDFPWLQQIPDRYYIYN